MTAGSVLFRMRAVGSFLSALLLFMLLAALPHLAAAQTALVLGPDVRQVDAWPAITILRDPERSF